MQENPRRPSIKDGYVKERPAAIKTARVMPAAKPGHSILISINKKCGSQEGKV